MTPRKTTAKVAAESGTVRPDLPARGAPNAPAVAMARAFAQEARAERSTQGVAVDP